LADGAFGAGALVGACAQTGAAINAANATPLNRRFIVSTSRMVANPPIAPEVANGDGVGIVQRLIGCFVARQCNRRHRRFGTMPKCSSMMSMLRRFAFQTTSSR